MTKRLLISVMTTLALGGVMGASAPALAQVGIEFRAGAPRAYEGYSYRTYSRPHVERRVVVVDDDEDCRMVVKRRVNRFGEVVVRRIRVCD